MINEIKAWYCNILSKFWVQLTLRLVMLPFLLVGVVISSFIVCAIGFVEQTKIFLSRERINLSMKVYDGLKTEAQAKIYTGKHAKTEDKK